MNRLQPQAVLLIAVPLGLAIWLLNWALADTALTLGNAATHIVVAMGYAVCLLCWDDWLARQKADGYAGWKRIAAAGKLRFTLRYGVPGKGWSFGVFMLAADWAGSGLLPPPGKIVLELLLWSVLGCWFAGSDWARMQREAEAH